MSFLRSVLISTPLIALSTIVMGTISLVMSLFKASPKKQYRAAAVWAKTLLAVSFIKVRTEGLERLDPNATYVFAANHGSYLDIPALLSTLPRQFRFFAKKGLFHIPFLGSYLRRNGHLPVDRSSPRNSLKSMTEGARIVANESTPVLLFPEGGRSERGLREFTEGAAYIAIKAGVPLVPVAIVGMRELLPMHSFHIRSGLVTIRIGQPIPTQGMKIGDRVELTRRAYQEIFTMMGEDQPRSSYPTTQPRMQWRPR